MAFFKFRKGGDEQPTPNPAPQSIEALRKRARHRLIGAALLVLVGVIGFPLLFDNQPRPVAVDIPIEIPDRNKVKPLVAPAPVAKASQVASEPAQPKEEVLPAFPAPAAADKTARVATGQISVPAPVASAPVVPVPAKAPPKLEPKPEAKPEVKPVDKPQAKVDEGAKAQALLEGKSVEPTPVAANGVRYIVQVGAFADAIKAREARMKVERAGLKTYTQVVQSPEGKRIRVRVGPVESKAEADKLAEKIRKLDLPAAILEL
jgi:DedD protein